MPGGSFNMVTASVAVDGVPLNILACMYTGDSLPHCGTYTNKGRKLFSILIKALWREFVLI